MKRVDVTIKGKEFTFRTNDSGDCLFTGVQENRQISCGSGFNSKKRMRQFIRQNLNEMGYTERAKYDWNEPYSEWIV